MPVIGFDITQRKQVEAELHWTVAREKELGRLPSNFVSMVSHEFPTPLGIIQSSAEILEDYLDQLEPAERKEHLQSIRAVWQLRVCAPHEKNEARRGIHTSSPPHCVIVS
jgi:signal transduction histidine kinase